jgi:catechol 2,3-dioxygenase-like lactoylglutathione lyase family enzyme
VALGLLELCIDARDPERLAAFWAGLLRRDVSADGRTVLPSHDTEFALRFLPSDAEKDGLNQVHLHLTSDTDDQSATVERALALGASHLDVGQRPDEGHVVLADPEGNELCVIEAGNAYLAGCGFLGELACDGTEEVGHFWSAALGWPLVWDQDGETAIQSPAGGAKVAWGGPPVRPKTGRNRMHLHLTPVADPGAGAPGGVEVEVARLVALGAVRLGAGEDAGAVSFADPDGNELCVVPG